MEQEIKKIAALIGHQQQQEKIVNQLIEAFKQELIFLKTKNYELDQAISGIHQSVSDAVTFALVSHAGMAKEVVEEVQKPLIKRLNEASDSAEITIKSIQREMNLVTWKSAIFIISMFMMGAGVLIGGSLGYINYLKSDMSKLYQQHEIWKKKAPFADISTCGKQLKPCVLVDENAGAYTHKSEPDKKYYIIKKP